jgi:hypothetical protein
MGYLKVLLMAGMLADYLVGELVYSLDAPMAALLVVLLVDHLAAITAVQSDGLMDNEWA